MNDRRGSGQARDARVGLCADCAHARIVRIDLDPPARAMCLFLWPRVRDLRVSVEDPDGLIEALTPGGVPLVTN